MFCSYCGKTLLNNPQTCPYCHMPVGESHFDGSPYTSAQPRMRPGQEAPRPAPRRYTPPAYSPDEELYSRTGYRASEPEETEALEIIIPKYVTSILYGALVEAIASENGARMQAMDSATSNAQDMIDHLTLQYNRARQGSITQELTEIIAGANAIQ